VDLNVIRTSTVSTQIGDNRALERRVEALARELAEEINVGGAEARTLLREIAVSTLRDEVREEPQQREEIQASGKFNSFGIGIPLLLMGAVLIFLFPPVGLLLFATAILALVWGVVATLFARPR
jgi:hypothetical protein